MEIPVAPGTPPAIARTQLLTAGAGIAPAGRFNILAAEQQKILTTPKGKFYSSFFEKHSEEIRALINKNKIFAMAWHRNRGPGILALMIQYVEKASLPFPKIINGRLFTDCIDNIGIVLKKFGSKSLKADFGATKKILLEVTKMNYQDFFSRHIAV